MSSVATPRRTGRSVHARGLRATNWPLREAPLRALSVLAACCGVGLLGGWLSASWSTGVLATLALMAVHWKLWVPVTTEFDPRGIVLTALRHRRRIAWRQIDHLELRDGGVFLCTRPGTAGATAMSSVFLPWAKQREKIALFCEEYRQMSVPDWSESARGSA